MREVLEAAERLAREEKKSRRRREDHTDEDTDATQTSSSVDSKAIANVSDKREQDRSQPQIRITNSIVGYLEGEKSDSPKDPKETENHSRDDRGKDDSRESRLNGHADKSEEIPLERRDSLQVPVSKDVAIVLSGRLDDAEILSKANLQLVNLVMSPSPRRFDAARGLSLGTLSAFVRNNEIGRAHV